MKRIFRLVLWVMLIPAVMTAGGCGSHSGEPEPEGPALTGPTIFVTFNVALPKTPGTGTRSEGSQAVSPVSRAEGGMTRYNAEDFWGSHDPTETGYEFDRRILKRNFSAVLYNKDNTYAGTVRDIQGWTDTSDAVQDVLTFRGRLETDVTSEEFRNSEDKAFKIMIFANVPEEFDGSEPDAKPEELQFARKGKEYEFDAIPLWGIQSVTMNALEYTLPGEDEKINELGEISLLRAMAMVRVNFALKDDQKDLDVELKRLTLNRHNASGYSLPSKWDELNATTELKLGESLRELKATGEETDGGYSVEGTRGENEKCTSIRFYLPEIANNKEIKDDEEVSITVDYTVNDEVRTGVIRFREYVNGQPEVDGEPYDIVRNHIYEFNITKVREQDVLLNAAVKDWRIIRYEFDY